MSCSHVQCRVHTNFRAKFTKFTGKNKRMETVLHSQVLVYFDKLVKSGRTGRGQTAFLPLKVQQLVKALHVKFPGYVFGEIQSAEDEGDESEGKDSDSEAEDATFEI